ALEEAFREFHYEAAVAAHEDGPAMLANLGKLRRRIRDMGPVGPREAAVELQRTRDLMENEALAPLVGTADDVVVLTTIHQAKGLEWPVVCLPNLQGTRPKTTSGFSARHGFLLCDALDDAGETVKLRSVTGVNAELAERAEQEERRLLYVALTRARERLLLSASVKPKQLAKEKDGKGFVSPFDFLLASTNGELAREGEHDCGSYRTRVHILEKAITSCTRFQGGAMLAESCPELGSTRAPDDAFDGGVPIPRQLPLSLKVTELLAYERC